ncbi:DNA topoisomerase 3 [Halomonas sp. 86]|uniref:DNA topoisomerase 3 n=1 Tax=unclassified Halomonas TaxID=2609666 RepID=UPI004034C085
MELYICEKPNQANDLAAVMGVSGRGNGYIGEGERIVTWAFGHLLELYMPHEYDEKYKSWNMDLLPIAPDTWRLKVKKSASKQFNIIKGLIKKAKTVVISTDWDREGEAIARNILEHAGYRGDIKRLRLSSLDPVSIKKALADVRPGPESIPYFHASLARQRADWLIGMNMSRLYSKLAEKAGYRQTLHVGRVLTPTVNLVCLRDQAIANFKASPYYVLTASAVVQQGSFEAKWVPPEEVCDEQGRCLNKAYADQVARQIRGKYGVIEHAETKRGKESPPLPFSITSLQQYANRQWGYSAQQVLDSAQALYETHKATTYPRADTGYLPVSQQSEVSQVLQCLVLSDQSISGLVAGADPERKCRAFNDKKVKAHHAIIPTLVQTDISKMSEIEFNLYDAIRRRYIANFYAPYEFDKTNVTLLVEGHTFNTSGAVPVRQGWKIIMDSHQTTTDEQPDTEDEEKENKQLPPIHQGEPAGISSATLADKQTRPPSHFTEDLLLGAMEHIAQYVDEPKFKEILKDSEGIGTGATRAGIIEGAVERGYLKRKVLRKRKVLVATDKAFALVAILPPALKSAGLTAMWEQQLEAIVDGRLELETFMGHMENWVIKIVNQVRENSEQIANSSPALAEALEKAKEPVHGCFTCGSPLKRIKGKHGFFWPCTSTTCNASFSDKSGKPVPSQAHIDASAPTCPECGKPMREKMGLKPGAKRKTKFFACSDRANCSVTLSPAEAKKRM